MTDIIKPVVYLRDKDGTIYAKFVVDRANRGGIEGRCYEATSWSGFDPKDEPIDWDFVADVYAKSDACTHWWFSGEDYDADSKSEDGNRDAYYHLCSQSGFMNHIRNMCFAWRAAEMLLMDGSDHDRLVMDNYRERKANDDIIDAVLKGYLFTLGHEKVGEVSWGNVGHSKES